MRLYMDLHIHSALSPCADNEMTPNNIVNMAWLKGLDIIAVTDHNSVENCEAVLTLAAERGILAIPGMEAETKEEVHILCLFPDLNTAKKIQEIIWANLPNIKNRVDIFGEQLIMDDQDNVTGQIERMLVTAANIGIEELFAIVTKSGGVCIPAHIDRASYSLLSNLGFIPEGLNIKYMELSKACNKNEFLRINKSLDKYCYICSSDAHILENILERDSYMELEAYNIESLFKVLKY